MADPHRTPSDRANALQRFPLRLLTDAIRSLCVLRLPGTLPRSFVAATDRLASRQAARR